MEAALPLALHQSVLSTANKKWKAVRNIYGIKILTVIVKQKNKMWLEELNFCYKISKLSAAVKAS
jgi:hypothetical protein